MLQPGNTRILTFFGTFSKCFGNLSPLVQLAPIILINFLFFVTQHLRLKCLAWLIFYFMLISLDSCGLLKIVRISTHIIWCQLYNEVDVSFSHLSIFQLHYRSLLLVWNRFKIPFHLIEFTRSFQASIVRTVSPQTHLKFLVIDMSWCNKMDLHKFKCSHSFASAHTRTAQIQFRMINLLPLCD